MDIILLIYIIGVVIAIVVNLAVFNFYKPECLTIGGLIIVILSCIASWLFILIAIITYWREIFNYEIWRRKR